MRRADRRLHRRQPLLGQVLPHARLGRRRVDLLLDRDEQLVHRRLALLLRGEAGLGLAAALLGLGELAAALGAGLQRAGARPRSACCRPGSAAPPRGRRRRCTPRSRRARRRGGGRGLSRRPPDAARLARSRGGVADLQGHGRPHFSPVTRDQAVRHSRAKRLA